MNRALTELLTLSCTGPFGAPVAFEGDEAGECGDGADNDRDGAFACQHDDCIGDTDAHIDTSAAAYSLRLEAIGDGQYVNLEYFLTASIRRD